MSANFSITVPEPPCNLTNIRNITEDGICDCREGYGGERCDEIMEWWETSERARPMFVGFWMFIISLWGILLVTHSLRFGKWKSLRQLAPMVTFLAIGGVTMRLVSLTVQPRVYGAEFFRLSETNTHQRGMLLAYGFLHSIAVAIEMASFGLIIGFWLDVTSKIRTTITRRTKVLAITVACVAAILSTGGLLMTFLMEDGTLGTIVVIISTFGYTIIITTLIVYLVSPCCGVSKKLLSENSLAANKRNYNRWVYMRRCLFFSLGFWYLYVFTAILVGPVTGMVGMASTRVIFSYITVTGECGFYTTLLFIIDWKGGILRLFSDLQHGSSSLDDGTRSTKRTQNTQSSAVISSKTSRELEVEEALNVTIDRE